MGRHIHLGGGQPSGVPGPQRIPAAGPAVEVVPAEDAAVVAIGKVGLTAKLPTGSRLTSNIALAGFVQTSCPDVAPPSADHTRISSNGMRKEALSEKPTSSTRTARAR